MEKRELGVTSIVQKVISVVGIVVFALEAMDRINITVIIGGRGMWVEGTVKFEWVKLRAARQVKHRVHKQQ